MLRYLRGTVLKKGPSSAVLLVGGLGFEVACPATTLGGLKEGQEAALYTRLIVREDDLSLFGFADEESLELFELLLSVSGVGPRVALSLLSSHTPALLARALAEGDLRLLTAAPGVGKKLAERIALELKGRVPAHLLGQGGGLVRNSQTEEAELALIALGFREGQVRSVVAEVARKYPGASTQELIKLALKALR
ncbi:MAG: Holliday junction branch migration protein RuvA [Meiothermus sp.]|uniref:Holliday junction branch migration protein RuvA n=1 Tax=Meiothermus sp. TaxID=1955249 RepID=UPI0025DDBC40|nr:Holliday junction branch migration protein RuvA [Meiothermus sp.]MCS7058191.1 Holliday junction branch migration protein RuvA [Meiothermus sp.]MCS7194431.1 Holliday junction branch migration protein RuvA [Meiothermus sp.]MCX7739451.1 Holliday junction branch migration protein RuvA [Meiothermus sp.]MDW8091089.1 Holliday junction branch migration protein RuvA [Meiothermus sp.]MDW8481376.1 Holliday junction branch migration protein RuvA [Meiothermus sp.]